jgi:hypothetical protein
MTLARRKEHVMTAKPKQQEPKQQDEPFDAERFRIELAHKLDRLVSEAIEGWRRCDNVECRRARSCSSDSFECIAKWRESLPPRSPEQVKAGVEDLRLSLDVRRRLGEESVTAEQLAEAIAKEKAARRAALPPQESDATPPVAEETKLAPEQQARINQAWKEYVKEQDGARERGPRITQL